MSTVYNVRAMIYTSLTKTCAYLKQQSELNAQSNVAGVSLSHQVPTPSVPNKYAKTYINHKTVGR